MKDQEQMDPIAVEEFTEFENEEIVVVEKGTSKQTILGIVGVALVLLGLCIYVTAQFIIPALTTVLSIIFFPFAIIFTYITAIISAILICIPVIGWLILLAPSMINAFVIFMAFAFVVGGAVIGIISLASAGKNKSGNSLGKVLSVVAMAVGGLGAVIMTVITVIDILLGLIPLAIAGLYVLFCIVMAVLSAGAI